MWPPLWTCEVGHDIKPSRQATINLPGEEVTKMLDTSSSTLFVVLVLLLAFAPMNYCGPLFEGDQSLQVLDGDSSEIVSFIFIFESSFYAYINIVYHLYVNIFVDFVSL